MPLYEYKCEKCDQVFEVIQKFSDEPLTEHQSCGGAVERLLSKPAFQFKGTGWYVTDYARSGGSKDSKPEAKKDSKSGSSSSSETKSDSAKPSTGASKDSSSK